MGRVTVAEVARYAGVSSAVVSYVINDGPRRVAPQTAQRVRDAIATLGYRPNSSARALRTGRTGIVGLVLPPTSNPFFGEYSDALYRAADEAEVALLVAGSGGSVDTEEAAVATMAQHEVDGMIVATSITPADVSGLRLPPVRVVLIDCPFPVPGQHTIGPASADGAQALVEHLLVSHHHRTVAYLSGDVLGADPDPRHLGWLAAHQRHGLTPGPLANAPYTRAGGYQAARELLHTQRPTALFVGSDLQAEGALRAIDEADLRVPHEIAVVSFDGTDQSSFTRPPMTVARQPVVDMAAAAMTTVLGADEPRHQVFPVQVVLRASCGCRRPPLPLPATSAASRVDGHTGDASHHLPGTGRA